MNAKDTEGKKNLDDDDEERVVEQELENVGIVNAPDGGYGWIVVIASFLVNALVDGIIYTTGQSLLKTWETDFNTTAMAASWAQSLLSGSYLLAGPLASALANQFGCRLVAIGGTFLAFAGFILSALVPALPILYLTFGVIGGLGFGLVYLPAIVIVNQYFEKRRALALGIAVCGSGIGTTVFSQVFPFLLNFHDGNWRMFLFNVSFIILICALCALTFKSLQPKDSQVNEVARIVSEYHEHHPEMQLDHRNKPVHQEFVKSPHIVDGVAIERFRSSTTRAPSMNYHRPFLSTIELNVSRRNEKDLMSNRDITWIASKKSVAELNRPLSRVDIFYPGSTTNLHRRLTHSLLDANDAREEPTSTRLSTFRLELEDDTPYHGEYQWTRGIRMAMLSMLDFSLLRTTSFLILNISGFMTTCCLFVPFMYIGEKASTVGATKDQQSYLLLLLGLINIIGRVICGILSDLPSVDPLMLSNISVLIGGIATICVPFLSEFWMYMAYTVPFAFAIACFAALRSVICVELLGLERLSSSFGIVLLFMGMAAFIGPPFAAFAKDLTGNYDLSFILMGTLMALSGAICLPLRYIRSLEEKRERGGIGNGDPEMEPFNGNSVFRGT